MEQKIEDRECIAHLQLLVRDEHLLVDDVLERIPQGLAPQRLRHAVYWDAAPRVAHLQDDALERTCAQCLRLTDITLAQ